MSKDAVVLILEGHVGHLKLNNSQAGNLFDLQMAQELAAACAEIDRNPEIYAAIITGAGNAFCAGGNERLLGEMVENAALECTPAEAVAGLACPTIAAINGDAFGLGFEIALACDIRLAADTARFGLPQITAGAMPMDGGTQRLARIAGRSVALEMVLSGETVGARQALAAGILSEVIAAAELASRADALAQTIAAKAPLALRYCKEAVNKGLDMTLEQGLRLEADLYFLLHTTADRTEGIRSFREKRPPQYRGE